jgi:hypothetical protein
MAQDRNGAAFGNGDDILLVGKCRSADYVAGSSLVAVHSEPMRVRNAEVVRADTLDSFLTTVGEADIQSGAVSWSKLDTRVASNIGSEANGWLNGGIYDWSSSVAGTGVWTQQKIRYASWAENTLEWERMQGVRTGAGTGVGNNAAAGRGQRDLWQHLGSRLLMRICTENQSRVALFRWGFWGNDQQPTASGTPTHGAWFEWNPTTFGTNHVYCVTKNGGSTTSASSGLLLANRTRVSSMLHYVSTSQVDFYIGTALPDSPSVSNTTNVPSGSTQRQGTLFLQIQSNGTGSWADLFLLQWRWFLDPDRLEAL